MLNTEQFECLSGQEHLTQVNTKVADLKRELERVLTEEKQKAISKLSKEADERDPNREKHKLTQRDANGILSNMGMKGIHTTPNGSYTGGSEAIAEYALSVEKHPDWANTIKYRNYYGSAFVSGMNLQKVSPIKEVAHFYSMVDTRSIDIHGASVINILNQAQEQVDMVYTNQYKNEHIAYLEDRVARLEHDFVDAIEATNDRLDTVEAYVGLHWKERAVQLKAKHPKIKQKELAEQLDVSLSSIKNYMCKPEVKAQVMALKENQ